MSYRKNKDIGHRVHIALTEKGYENPCVRLDNTIYSDRIITDNPYPLWLSDKDESQKDTPARVYKMYLKELFYGLDYDNFPDTMEMSISDSIHQPIILSNIPVKSMCEHHLMPIVGVCTLAYKPNKFTLGLSKFNRIVDFFSRRPQMQERLTKQIYIALSEVLQTPYVAVYIKAKHMCVSHRGKGDHGCETITYEVPPISSQDINSKEELDEFFHTARSSTIID